MVVLSPTLEKDSQREVTMTLGWSQVTGFPGVVKNLPAKQETWVQSLGQEDHLEKEMATHSSTLAWEIPWTEETGGLQSTGVTKESDTMKQLNINSQVTHCHFQLILLVSSKLLCVAHTQEEGN